MSSNPNLGTAITTDSGIAENVKTYVFECEISESTDPEHWTSYVLSYPETFCSKHYQTTSLTAFGFLAIVTLLIFPFFTRITLSAASANAEL